jgi:alpha-1,2-mannosyltransferase
LVNLGLLTSLLVLGDPRTASRRRLLLAGVALGLATSVKLWAVVPLVVLLCWVAFHRRRAALTYVGGAAAAGSLVCLPFFLLAPASMFRLVVLDLLARPDNAVPWAKRLARVTTSIYLDRAVPHQLALLAVLVSALVLVAVAVVVRRSPEARPWCALLAAQSALLLTGPSFYPHYSTYVAPALALVVGATADVVRNVLHRAPIAWTPAALTSGVMGAVLLLGVSSWRAEGLPAPGREARSMLSSARCVAADAPATLAAADLLGHDLRHDCAVVIDPTGLMYDQHRGERRAASTVRARLANVEWQRRIQRWFDGSQVIIVQHGNPAGLSPATLRALASRSTVTSFQRYEVYVADPRPAACGSPSASRCSAGARAGRRATELPVAGRTR